MRTSTLAPIGGLGAVILGLLYATHAFGPTEAEVVLWGRLAIIGGAGLVLGTIVTRQNHSAVARLTLAAGCGAIALFQVPPAILWVVFHGTGISDGSPPSAFVAHWAYALPHSVTAAVCLFAAYRLIRHDETARSWHPTRR